MNKLLKFLSAAGIILVVVIAVTIIQAILFLYVPTWLLGTVFVVLVALLAYDFAFKN